MSRARVWQPFAPTASAVWLWAFGLFALVVGCHASQPPGAGNRQLVARERSGVADDDAEPSGLPDTTTDSSASGPSDEDYDDDSEGIGDESSDADEQPTVRPRDAHPFDGLSDAELTRRLKANPEALGAASLGRPNAGGLFNAVQLSENAAWKRVDPSHAWATPETIEDLSKSLQAVAKRFPGTEPLPIGHLSAQKGGHLRPHVSHQSGRDVDVGIYYSGEPYRWYQRAAPDSLDLERTWWFIRTLVLETKIEMILLDQSFFGPLERHALSSGEDRDWVEGIFHRKHGRPGIVRHASGHATHLHLRFFNPVAQESGRRLMPLLVARGMVTAPPKFASHVARSGDTLAKLAARYSTTMQAIQKANGMKTYQLVAGRTYRIPIPR